MYQQAARHPLSINLPPLSDEVFESMWQLFVHIGTFWQNMDNPEPLKPMFYTFLLNRINLYPIYQEYYRIAKQVMDLLIAEYGEEQAYELLFTDADAAKSPPETPVALTRQAVANEFMAWQLALGGFKAWGATNYCGYIGGGYIPGNPAPYRTFEGQS
jgi:hypothetical protein